MGSPHLPSHMIQGPRQSTVPFPPSPHRFDIVAAGVFRKSIALCPRLLLVTGVLDVLVADVLPLPLRSPVSIFGPKTPQGPRGTLVETYALVPVVPEAVHAAVEATITPVSKPRPRIEAPISLGPGRAEPTSPTRSPRQRRPQSWTSSS